MSSRWRIKVKGDAVYVLHLRGPFQCCHRCLILEFVAEYPKKKHRKDVSNFDKQFTGEKTDLTPTDKLFMMNLDQTEFTGFSYLNPDV
uniref:AGC-kinase C-terminal domain-containing protein n=1 Tax=Strigamia maritima TaxID=126957 RepID=T1IXL7_STRMM